MTRGQSRWFGWPAAIGFVVIFAGCAPDPAKVSGRVTYQGKPVVCGYILMEGGDGLPATGRIAQDGTYVVPRVAAGQVRYGVVSPDPTTVQAAAPHLPFGSAKSLPPPPKVDRTKWFPLPAELGSPSKSGLATELRSGSNTLDIDLP